MCAHNDKPPYIASRLTCCDRYWNIWQNKLHELVIGYIYHMPEYTEDVLYRHKMYISKLTIYYMTYTLMEWFISIVMKLLASIAQRYFTNN